MTDDTLIAAVRAPLAFVAAAFAVGIGLAWWVKSSVLLLWIPLVIGAAGFLRAGKRPAAANLCLIALVVGLGALRAGADAQIPPSSIGGSLTESPQPITCEGILISDLEWIRPPQGPARRQGWLEITQIQQPQGWIPSCGRLLLRLPAVGALLLYGDRVKLQATVRAGRPATEGHPFNEEQRLWLRGACGVLAVADPEGVSRLPSDLSGWVRYRRWVCEFRTGLENLGRSLMGPREAAILEGLLLGEFREIPKDVEEAFKKTGTVHVLVVSGQHVSLVGCMIFVGLGWVRIPRGIRFALLGGGLVGYCLLTGCKPPILRATIMGLLFCLGRWRGEPSPLLNGLGLAALAILAADPRALADVSFQLSFASMIGLLSFSPWFEKKLEPGAEEEEGIQDWGWRLRRHLVKGLAASCAAWAAIAPIVAWHFRMVTPIALIANLLVVPWASALIAAGFLLYAAGLIHLGAAVPLAAGFGWMVGGLNRLVAWMAALPGGSWSWQRF